MFCAAAAFQTCSSAEASGEFCNRNASFYVKFGGRSYSFLLLALCHS